MFSIIGIRTVCVNMATVELVSFFHDGSVHSIATDQYGGIFFPARAADDDG